MISTCYPGLSLTQANIPDKKIIRGCKWFQDYLHRSVIGFYGYGWFRQHKLYLFEMDDEGCQTLSVQKG
jgi:hypothetical protein